LNTFLKEHLETDALFSCSNPEYAVMLRHEASATYETDASCLSMTTSGITPLSSETYKTNTLKKAKLIHFPIKVLSPNCK
jgi:hypothetical protein